MRIYQYNKDFRSGNYAYSFIVQKDILIDRFTRVYTFKNILHTENCSDIHGRRGYTTLILKLD